MTSQSVFLKSEIIFLKRITLIMRFFAGELYLFNSERQPRVHRTNCLFPNQEQGKKKSINNVSYWSFPGLKKILVKI